MNIKVILVRFLAPFCFWLVVLPHLLTDRSYLSRGSAPNSAAPTAGGGTAAVDRAALFTPATPMRIQSSGNFDIPPYDPFFSSWRTWTPDFSMLTGFPPFMKAPRVQVFCDESQLTVLVDKRTNGFKLTGEEIQLGDRCYSNRDLPHQFVFTYDFDQCGTTQVMQNGFEVFSNSLHLNLRKTFPSWWQVPSTIYVSCIPTRSYYNPNSLVSTSRVNEKSFHMKAMTSSWTSTADSNIYKRGQVVNLQVSAEMRPDEKLFIQSCYVSASPEPQTRPRHAVIMNKGCTSPLGSPHAVVQFVASNKAGVVNFVLNTSYLISELYIHCSVLLSDQGITSGSKSCNYNSIQSRWEELSGDVAVCDCCKSKCKGLSVNNLPNGAKAIVSSGPVVIVDRDRSSAPPVSEPQETSSNPASITMRSSVPDLTEDVIVAGSSVSRSLPQGVVVVSQDPASRLTLWLPEELQDNEYETGSQSLTVELHPSADILDDDPKLQPSTTDQKSNLKPSTNEIESENSNEASVSGLNLLTMVEGWSIPPQLDKTVSSEEFRRKKRLETSGKFGTKAAQMDLSLPAEINVNYLVLVEKPNPAEAENAAIAEESQRKRWFPAETVVNYLDHMRDELAEMQLDADVMTEQGTNDDQPVIRSKLEFSKGSDGSQSLSYEEEVVKQQEEPKRKQKRGLKGMRSTFLQLLRRMDKAE
uniref:ZP domain-containing protein n=1 Tax=Amphiprion percula TaxID=161767 RepID=A0A3P8TQV7_AMPPE